MPMISSSRLRQVAGPFAVLVGLLLAHWAFSVPKSTMLTKRDKARAGAPAQTKKGKGREAAAFAKERPDPGFEATHRPALEHAVELARQFVETRDGPPSAQEASFDRKIECRRWRCQVQICASRKRARAVHRVLRKMELEDDVLFDAFEAQKPKPKGKKKGTVMCIKSTVRFSRPAPEIKGIRVSKASTAAKKDGASKREGAKQGAPKAQPRVPTGATSGRPN